MSDETTPAPDLLDLMAEAMTATFTGHPQRRAQALAANRVIAERMWPPVQSALDERDAEIKQLRAGESEQPAPEGQELTPPEWIHKFNRATAQERITHIESMLSLTRQATVCWHQDHASLKERLDATAEELRAAEATVARVRELLPHLDTLAYKLSRKLPEQAAEWIREIIDCVRIALDRPEEPTVHACPLDGSGVMPRCGRSPIEVPGDRLAFEPGFATCTGQPTTKEVLTAGLDNLPAVREFVAGFDPRGEPS